MTRENFDTVFPLMAGRMHEAFGASARSFAAICAGLSSGPCLWVQQDWDPHRINPLGLMNMLAPERLLVARPSNHIDALAVTEEALRDGAVPFVIVDLHAQIDLREGRRLQLAAQAGGSTGLGLIRAGLGSNAAQTRWDVAPIYDGQGADSTLMRWKLTKNKTGTIGAWDVRWEQETRRLHLVSASGE